MTPKIYTTGKIKTTRNYQEPLIKSNIAALVVSQYTEMLVNMIIFTQLKTPLLDQVSGSQI